MTVWTEKRFIEELKAKGLTKDSLEEKLVTMLTAQSLKISTAESCTGGMVSQKITGVSGASAVFDCGVCSYSNKIKEKVLGVEAEVLNTFGAVSQQTAVQMAKGVRELANSDIGVSTTGVAGPTGGSKEKPVGLVYIGCSTKNNDYALKTMLSENGKNNREAIRKLAAELALYVAIREIAGFSEKSK